MSTDAARQREDRAAWFIFVILLAMGGTLAGVFLTEERPHVYVVEDGVTQRDYRGHGVPHPRFAPSMTHGGDGRERHEDVIGFAWAFALLSFAFGTGCVYLGSLKACAPSPLKKHFLAAGIVGCCAISAMFFTYWNSLDDDAPAYFLGFPEPTAWMLFGVAGAPLLIVWAYIAYFDSWFAPPEINEEFQRIKAAAQSRNGEQA